MLTFLPTEHVYLWNRVPVPGVTSVLENAGFYDWSRVDKATLLAGRERGSIVHRATELHDKKQPQDHFVTEDRYAGYLAGWILFLVETKFKIERIEERLYNHKYGYAGTEDRDGELDSDLAVLDIKTGVPQPATGPQTAAYDVMLPKPPLDRRRRRWAVYLQPKGTYRLVEHKDPADIGIFLAALATYRWREKHGLNH